MPGRVELMRLPRPVSAGTLQPGDVSYNPDANELCAQGQVFMHILRFAAGLASSPGYLSDSPSAG